MIKHYDVEQGSKEWMVLRAGIPTASRFDEIISPTGKQSAQADAYIAELIAETILGCSLDTISNDWIERGKMLEESAVTFYELQRDLDTEKIGFVTTDDGLIGCSPDRLVGDRGGLEIKCPSPAQHVLYLLDTFRTKYKPQVQGCLWVCELDWWDMLSYHPEMPPALMRVERDESYIKLMKQYMDEFQEKLAERSERVLAMLRETERGEL